MTTKSKCKTFADICRMLDNSIRKGNKVKIGSRPMPSDEFLAQEKAEIKAFVRKREERRLYVKNQLLFLKQKDNKREELKNKGNTNK